MIQARGQKGGESEGGRRWKECSVASRAREGRTVPPKLGLCSVGAGPGWAGLSCACSAVAYCRFVPSPWRNLEMRAPRALWVRGASGGVDGNQKWVAGPVSSVKIRKTRRLLSRCPKF